MPSSPDAVLRGTKANEASPYTPGPFTSIEPRPSPTSNPQQVRLDDVYAAELERLRAEARTEGFAQGHAEGLRAAEEAIAQAQAEVRTQYNQDKTELERRLTSAAAALTNAAHVLDQRTAPLADDIATTVTNTAFGLVEDLLRRELVLSTDPGRDAIQRALTVAPDDAPIRIRIHPNDYTNLGPDVLAELPTHVTVSPDPSVEPAGATAESGARRIDAQISTALDRVRDALYA